VRFGATVKVQSLLAPLTMPVFVIPGNHDRRIRGKAEHML
jgi:DNA repair exonuclease SbcCD nuclease subunit